MKLNFSWHFGIAFLLAFMVWSPEIRSQVLESSPTPIKILQSGQPPAAVIPAESDNTQQEKAKKPIIKLVAELPALPPDLAGQKAEGIAKYSISLNHRGEVARIQPEPASQIPNLDAFVESWIRLWQFEPGYEKGFPIASGIQVSIHYNLSKSLIEYSENDVPVSISPAPVVETSPEASAPPAESPSAVECADASLTKKPVLLQEPKFSAIPNEIQNLKLKGVCKFKIQIDETGRTTGAEVETSSGSEPLDEWIKPSLLKCEWEPAMQEETPVSCWKSVTIDFNTTACQFTLKPEKR